MKRWIVLAALAAVAACSGVLPIGNSIKDVVPAERSPRFSYVEFLLDKTPATSPAGRKVTELRFTYPGNHWGSPAIRLSGGVCKKCTVSVKAPASVHVFYVEAYDVAGKRLSSTTIYENGSLVFITLATAVAWVTLAADNTFPPYGKKATLNLYVNGQAQANGSYSTIVGPGPYSSPIHVTAAAFMTGMKLSKTIVKTPAEAMPTLGYSGGNASAYITVSIGKAVQTILITPQLQATVVPAPSPAGYASLSAAGSYAWYSGSISPSQPAATITRIDTTGAMQPFSVSSAGAQPGPLAAAADGSVWYLGCNTESFGSVPDGIGYISAAGIAGFFPYSTVTCGDDAFAQTAAWAPDGKLWFVTFDRYVPSVALANITTAGTTTSVPVPRRISYNDSVSFTSDGSIWILENDPFFKADIDRLTPSGALVDRVKGSFDGVFSDGNHRVLAFSYLGIQVIDTTTNTKKTLPIPQYLSVGNTQTATVTPDGAIWLSFAQSGGGDIGECYLGRFASDTAYQLMAVPCAGAGYEGGSIVEMAATGDGQLWIEGGPAPLARIPNP